MPTTLLRVFFIIELSLAVVAQTTTSRVWTVKLADGSDTELIVTDHSGIIEFRTGQALAFTIPATSITEILHSTQRIRRSARAYNYFERMCCGGTQSQLLPALAAAVSAPLGHSKDHYVEVHWYSNGDGAVVLQLPKEDYVPFMDWLQQASGTKWVDVEQDREQALKQIKERAGAAFPIRLAYPSAAAGDHWTYDSYLALPVDMRGQTQLYFFRDKVKADHVLGIVPVTEEWSENGCARGVEVLYGKCGANGCPVEAVLLPTLTYRVMSPPGVIETDAAGHPANDCARVKQQQAEWRKRGESESQVSVQRKPD
jgi:hypothetical protein